MTTVNTRPPTTRGTPSMTRFPRHPVRDARHPVRDARHAVRDRPCRGLQSTFAHHLTLSMKEHSHDL
jgi:hypothetical protein